MLFKKELAEKILTGEKTQTRRPVKAGEELVERDGLLTVLDAHGRMKMQVGRDYAVQYGRGKPCRWWHTKDYKLLPYEVYLEWVNTIENYETELRLVGYKLMRIRVTDIRREDVRTINLHDSIAEGFFDHIGFLDVWARFYDKPALKIPEWYLAKNLMTRPHELYQAWAYTFELV